MSIMTSDDFEGYNDFYWGVVEAYKVRPGDYICLEYHHRPETGDQSEGLEQCNGVTNMIFLAGVVDYPGATFDLVEATCDCSCSGLFKVWDIIRPDKHGPDSMQIGTSE